MDNSWPLWVLLALSLSNLLTSAAPMDHCPLGPPAQAGQQEQHGNGGTASQDVCKRDPRMQGG